jgi:hypothetical protein
MIDYRALAEALAFYQAHHFKRVELPWTASEAAQLHTWGSRAFLVGSAEQAFLDQPPEFDAVAITPCFRWGDAGKSKLHMPYFMKVELWSRTRTPAMLAGLAQEFLGGMIVVTPDGLDIELNGIEVGSYGCRVDLQDREYCYGTGLAEPRWSLAKKEEK